MRTAGLLVFAAALLLAGALYAGEDARAPAFVAQYCLGCHGAEQPKGGLNLALYQDLPSIQRSQTVWRKVLSRVRDRSMPPRGAARPNETQRGAFLEWLAQALDSVDEKLIPPDPGRTVIRRLNREEYNNTVRDLFGVSSRPAHRFPADGGGGAGFDNNADTLFVPPILMERLLEAAGEVVKEAPPARILLARPGKGLPAREAARTILAGFALRGYRRPPETAEVERLLKLYDQASSRGERFESAVRFALKAVLVSPSFLFRIEPDRPEAGPHPVSDYELASRLSYFLWVSMPDEELFRLAGEKRLRDPKILGAQVRRMLRDPRVSAFTESFAGQWLRLRELYVGEQPDPRRYPEFTPTLRDAMFREAVELLGATVREDASLLQLIDADYTYANEELAAYYGLEGVKGPEFRRVKLPDRNRGGLVTTAAVLTVTSYPRRTSPVLRGKWVLEELLGADVPPPPPNAGGLPADDGRRGGETFRQRLEKHREKPECSGCHSRMDPIGFGLENFDPIGRWRTEAGGEQVDNGGTLPTGEKFAGPAELKRLLLLRKDEFLRNLAGRMLSYALGRGLEHYDLPALRRITAAVARDGYRSSTLLTEIAKSYPFLNRRSE